MKLNLGLESNQAINKRINKEDLKPHHSVAAIFSRNTKDNKDIEYLIQSHKKHKMYTFPVGKVKPDQTVTEALLAENKEELGVAIENFMELLQFTREYDFNGKMVPVVTHLFKVIKFNGTPKNAEPNKHDWIKWMTREQIEKSQHKLGDCVTRYFAWLDDINSPSLVKPNVTVGKGH